MARTIIIDTPAGRRTAILRALYPHLRKEKTMEKATELEYLKWFYINADFGPADGDVRLIMNQQFTGETGKAIPDGYGQED